MICSTARCIPERGAERKRANYPHSDVESRKRAGRKIITSKNLGCSLHMFERQHHPKRGELEAQVNSGWRNEAKSLLSDKISWVLIAEVFRRKKALIFRKPLKPSIQGYELVSEVLEKRGTFFICPLQSAPKTSKGSVGRDLRELGGIECFYWTTGFA